MNEVVERFLNYVKYNTQSKEFVDEFPSTPNQIVLMNALKNEVEKIGVKDVTLDDHGYLMAHIPSNINKKVPKIGFIAHVDTSPDMNGADIKPRFVENYDGKDILLNKKLNIVLSTKEFPDIVNYKGETLIVTDGTSLLGADDKAGVAEIMTAVNYIVNHPDFKHGDISIAFTPDEEVGRGVDFFDVKKFNADYAYTMDGGTVGQLELETFNAAEARITVHGKSVHPGSAKGKMINAISVASELVSMIPEDEVPEKTEGYEGFYHIHVLNGQVEKAFMAIIIRDFDRSKFEDRKRVVEDIVKKLNEKYGENVVELNMVDQYYNMKEKIEPVKFIVKVAKKAMESLGIKPIIDPVRGGTDGSRLSFMGLPTPNIFAGGENFHGKYEYVPVSAMEKAVKVIVKIIELYTKEL